MNKIEFLATSLPYGLKVVGNKYINDKAQNTYKYSGNWYDTDIANNQISGIIPIVRHMDTLTKECVQADYNDGKPFIPIVELFKLSDIRFALFKPNEIIIPYRKNSIVGAKCISLIKAPFEMDLDNLNKSSYWAVNLLIKWHFDLIDEDCEKVYVTEEFNPYK